MDLTEVIKRVEEKQIDANLVEPDQGPNCLQRLSADKDTRRQRVKVDVVFRKVN